MLIACIVRGDEAIIPGGGFESFRDCFFEIVSGFTTNITAVLSCVNNIGPGVGKVGPMSNFGEYSAWSKVLLSFDMLLGRLEILPMLVLFTPGAWKKH